WGHNLRVAAPGRGGRTGFAVLGLGGGSGAGSPPRTFFSAHPWRLCRQGWAERGVLWRALPSKPPNCVTPSIVRLALCELRERDRPANVTHYPCLATGPVPLCR